MVEYAVQVPGGLPDLATLERALGALDPAAVLDLADGGRALRISTWATAGEVVECLRSAGVDAGPDALVQLPSVCCGGCSG